MVLFTYDPILGLRIVYAGGPFLRLPASAAQRISRRRKPIKPPRRENQKR